MHSASALSKRRARRSGWRSAERRGRRLRRTGAHRRLGDHVDGAAAERDLAGVVDRHGVRVLAVMRPLRQRSARTRSRQGGQMSPLRQRYVCSRARLRAPARARVPAARGRGRGTRCSGRRSIRREAPPRVPLRNFPVVRRRSPHPVALARPALRHSDRAPPRGTHAAAHDREGHVRGALRHRVRARSSAPSRRARAGSGRHDGSPTRWSAPT